MVATNGNLSLLETGLKSIVNCIGGKMGETIFHAISGILFGQSPDLKTLQLNHIINSLDSLTGLVKAVASQTVYLETYQNCKILLDTTTQILGTPQLNTIGKTEWQTIIKFLNRCGGEDYYSKSDALLNAAYGILLSECLTASDPSTAKYVPSLDCYANALNIELLTSNPPLKLSDYVSSTVNFSAIVSVMLVMLYLTARSALEKLQEASQNKIFLLSEYTEEDRTVINSLLANKSISQDLSDSGLVVQIRPYLEAAPKIVGGDLFLLYQGLTNGGIHIALSNAQNEWGYLQPLPPPSYLSTLFQMVREVEYNNDFNKCWWFCSYAYPDTVSLKGAQGGYLGLTGDSRTTVTQVGYVNDKIRIDQLPEPFIVVWEIKVYKPSKSSSICLILQSSYRDGREPTTLNGDSSSAGLGNFNPNDLSQCWKLRICQS